MRLILLGAPGAGKGTLSAYLADKFGYKAISTGDLIRAEIKSGSELGNSIKSLVENGKLIGDDIVNKLIDNFIVENQDNQNLIFDGYPRTVDQAKYLDSKTNIDKVLLFNIDKETLEKRITGR
jgi:adenylate kinase